MSLGVCLVRQGASHSFELALPALISEVRDFRKDVVDEVLVRLALGEVEEALAACDRLKEGPFVAGVNLRVEVLVRMSAKLEEQGSLEQAVLALTRAIKLDASRSESLQPQLNVLLAKRRAAHSHQHQQQQLLLQQQQRNTPQQQQQQSQAQTQDRAHPFGTIC